MERKKVIVVDDTKKYRVQATEQLTSHYELTVLSSFERAVEFYKKGTPLDYALFDGFMPVKSLETEERVMEFARIYCRRADHVKALEKERGKGLVPAGMILVVLYGSRGIPSFIVSSGKAIDGYESNGHHAESIDPITQFVRALGIQDSPCEITYDPKTDTKYWLRDIKKLEKQKEKDGLCEFEKTCNNILFDFKLQKIGF